jgi:hypothetical protein
VKPHETAAFLTGYGETTVDSQALTYYRYAWAVQDLAAYAEQACFKIEASDETRRAALEGIKSIFEPGQIAAIAFASEAGAD